MIVTRKNLAAQRAIDLREWTAEASLAGMLRPGVARVLLSIADDVTYDAQLSIAYPPNGPDDPQWTPGH